MRLRCAPAQMIAIGIITASATSPPRDPVNRSAKVITINETPITAFAAELRPLKSKNVATAIAGTRTLASALASPTPPPRRPESRPPADASCNAPARDARIAPAINAAISHPICRRSRTAA